MTLVPKTPADHIKDVEKRDRESYLNDAYRKGYVEGYNKGYSDGRSDIILID